jgi:TrwC relaxase/AAA domain
MLNFRKISAASDGAAIRAYMTQDQPEPETLKVHGVALDGRDLETGERLTAYYTGRGERANWRPDMDPRVAAALGIANAHADPRNAQLDALFEARRADTGEDWSKHVRTNSGFDFVFAPHKSVSLAAEFAPTEAERQMIRNAIHAASDDALRYAAQDLGYARRGHAGMKGAEAGEIGWVTFAHDAARPTVAIQDGSDGAIHLLDAPIAGDPHYHLHNFIPNLVVTDDGRVGSIDSKALTTHKVPEYGAFFQARLADRLRSLGVRIGLDAGGEAAVALDIPESAVTTFSKRDRQVEADAQRYARDLAMDWDELSLERKQQILHEASAAGRLRKTKEDTHAVWREQVAELGWTPESVLGAASAQEPTAVERRETAYEAASASLSAEFQLKAVLDAERLRVHAARGLIEAGAEGGRGDVDAVVALIETRGFVHDDKAVTLISGMHEGKERISHTEQLRIEQTVAEMSRAAARDHSASLSDTAIRAAIERVEADDAGVRFSKEQLAAIHALGAGGRLSLLTGVAGSGKTTLLRPLVDAWRDDGRTVVGMSTAWRQADALKDAGVNETWALQPLLNAIDTGEFRPDAKTVLVIDEISQIGPRPMLELLELQAKTGMTIKMLGDREQVQSIDAGDTIALLKRVLPKGAMPDVLTAVRQKNDRDRKIAALFRAGKADTAFAMKREDGTARLLEGDTDQVVRQIADLYIERRDALKAQDPSYGVTITTLTNAEAADISRAIRERLKARGEIGTDEATYKAVVYRADKAEFFDLPIATGDRLRMYRKTVAQIDGKRATIGNNGDIVEVVRKTAAGLVLRNARGQTAEIDWKRLSDQKTGRLLLGFGHAFTIDAAQGMSTKGEHINALPHGTAATSAFKTYTAESRATGRTQTLISKAAVHAAVQRSRALGDVTPMTEEDLWTQVAKDASEKPYKALALDIVGKARRQHDKAVQTGLSNHNRIETATEARSDLGVEMKASYQTGLLRQAFEQQRDAFVALVAAIDEQLKRAAGVVLEQARVIATTIKGAPVARAEDANPTDTPAPAPSAHGPGF